MSDPLASRTPAHCVHVRDFNVVGIGASAGGLEACRALMDALPAATGMAFILVQHLDPTHQSMMVDLLAQHTAMPVLQATDGMRIERDHLYLIPPGTYLSVGDGTLHLLPPQARHGARLPFDFLLHSLATEFGPRAVGVILSGTGADGTLGAESVRAAGGMVIAQDPIEATFDGMPRAAIAAGVVDEILPVAEIPAALSRPRARSSLPKTSRNRLPDVIRLLAARTGHDFALHKPGTLRRRIERRMTMRAMDRTAVDRYLDILRRDAEELDALAKDLHIHVTSFFRDPKAFEALAETVLPDLVRDRQPDQPLRIWIAGCSTGEEVYSLAMLLLEQISAAGAHARLQVFASDIDADAIATAREGIYPASIADAVSPERLARFFTKEDRGYRVVPELRGMVVFAVQDILADPPFSRLDLVSCRNVLIYLGLEAQARIIGLFHFALRPGGVLMLGSAETVGSADDSFTPVAGSERIYRRVGRSRSNAVRAAVSTGDSARAPPRAGLAVATTRSSALAELCRQLVIDAFAPAAILVDRNNACVYSLGPTERYLRLPSGHPTHDLLALAPPTVRARLQTAIHKAIEAGARVSLPASRRLTGGERRRFTIEVQPVVHAGETYFLICFVEAAALPAASRRAAAGDAPRVDELEKELDTTRHELHGAIRRLEIAADDQRTVHDEALSINEEYQSANEELLTSKEELQSLNEELTALNSQLQETLERQRTTSDDLQNVLYSTDVATVFLDPDLHIRFFTPATEALFHVIAGDIGRPLADLRSLSSDETLLSDAGAVLKSAVVGDREIEVPGVGWYLRRILPYRTHGNRVAGVVITFTDVTDRRHVTSALEAAKHEAEQANITKSRFLAAASHDLRQPLQTLVLLQGLLAKTVQSGPGQELVSLLDPTLGAMSGMLNTLLDINQIETGTVASQVDNVVLDDILVRLQEEFTHHARAQGIAFRVVPCGLVVRTDARLLEQMLRNLLSNAFKYTRQGKVLVGCRRHAGSLRIEVRDTGIGIAPDALHSIFDEYHQVDNAARQRSRGLGLGLSIVRRLGLILGHAVEVSSRAGQGSVFSIEVARAAGPVVRPKATAAAPAGDVGRQHRQGVILLAEDDPEVRYVLSRALEGEGHRVIAAADGTSALALVASGGLRPDIILADYNLPGGMDGLQLAATLRQRLNHTIPLIILTGDISTETLREIALLGCDRLHKPAKLPELTATIQRLLEANPAHVMPAGTSADETPTVHVIDDDRRVRDAIKEVLEDAGMTVAEYGDGPAFLAAYRSGGLGCVLIDANLPGMVGLEVLARFRAAGHRLPGIVITGHGDVRMAVAAMKAGATDFVEKPVSREDLLASIGRALELARDARTRQAWRDRAAGLLATLTARQREVLDAVLAGQPSKNIATDLGISQRTVESHRAAIMQKTGATSLPALARLAQAAIAEP
ncbi:chemotaxis protein CheB [Roseomonas fluvialis]|uniref:histidine kinase n=1 Tax=Roseomonas fluvialis TaxID=1750527 RepID=A0ABN6NW38_9PROT|nr:chemotaxis protein CheB [Roseomonas fluvialis]BDG70466.1 protein-glutamate methylesterase [Roseomonas fluvialis]